MNNTEKGETRRNEKEVVQDKVQRENNISQRRTTKQKRKKSMCIIKQKGKTE